MATDLTSYFANVDTAIGMLEILQTRIEAESAKVEDFDLDDHDWGTMLWSIQNSINALTLASVPYKFERISLEQMQALFAAQSQGVSAGKIIVSATHVVRPFDTLRSLELLTGVAWEDILEYNQMKASDFVSGITIKIPLEVGVGSVVRKDIPVFGTQEGLYILGQDLPNELVADTDLDFKVLPPQETIKQFVENLSTTLRGDIAYDEDFGLDLGFGEDWPIEAVAGAIQIKIVDGFLADPRIKDVTILDVNRQQNTVTVKTHITPIRGGSIIIPEVEIAEADWRTWGQENVHPFAPNYTKTFEELP